MPVYEYRCKSCGETHEIEHGYNDDRPTKCPTCGGQLIRVFHPIGLVFKGSGFHKTDYGKSGLRATPSESSGASAGEGKSGEGKSAEGKPAEGASSEGKSSESKSAGDKSGESKSAEGKSASKPSESKSSTDSKPSKAP